MNIEHWKNQDVLKVKANVRNLQVYVNTYKGVVWYGNNDKIIKTFKRKLDGNSVNVDIINHTADIRAKKGYIEYEIDKKTYENMINNLINIFKERLVDNINNLDDKQKQLYETKLKSDFAYIIAKTLNNLEVL